MFLLVFVKNFTFFRMISLGMPLSVFTHFGRLTASESTMQMSSSSYSFSWVKGTSKIISTFQVMLQYVEFI